MLPYHVGCQDHNRLYAYRCLRRMRGQTRAWLVDVGNHGAFVTKFTQNPLGLRALVCEWIGSLLMRSLGLPVPNWALIGSHRPDLFNASGVPDGWHFGSQFPGDPSRTAVYDFLPGPIFERDVVGTTSFLGAFVFDVWVANVDSRQAVFYRDAGDTKPAPLRFCFIDHSHIFGGPLWRFSGDSPSSALFPLRRAYRSLRSLDDLAPWIETVNTVMKDDIIGGVFNDVPLDWLDANLRRDLHRISSVLINRKHILADLVVDRIQSTPDVFQEWYDRR